MEDAQTAVAEVPAVNNYQYRDAQLNVIWVTSVPRDDEAAVAYFHTISRFPQGFRPVYVEKKVLVDGSERYRGLPFIFDPDTFTTRER